MVCLRGVCGLGVLGVRWGAAEAGKAAESFGNAFMVGMIQVQAAAAVQANPTVREKLGDPINIGAPSNEQNDIAGGSAKMDLEVSGPKGKATAHIESRREGEAWKITTLQVRCDDGTVIDVDANQLTPMPSDSDIPFGGPNLDPPTSPVEPEPTPPTP